MSGIRDLVGDALGALVYLLRPGPPAVVVVRPAPCARVDALPASDGGDAPQLEDEPGPDEPHDVVIPLRSTDLYWLIVRGGQHVAAYRVDPETAAQRVMADIELRGVEETVR